MITLKKSEIILINNSLILDDQKDFNEKRINDIFAEKGIKKVSEKFDINNFKKNTITYKILSNHNSAADNELLKIKFDSLASHDITYVGIIQTARASGLKQFPVPYVLTNCHNSLCAVGGTINDDDHLFGFSAAQKYGGIFVPAHQAVIHQYVRESTTGCGKMILGSDSHTRYGALGTMGIGEGGPEIVKQLLERSYDINYPEVIAVYLDGKISSGVGPQDVALAIIKAVFENGFVKNKVMEFVGPGIENLSIDFRNCIDVMTTETTCLSSIWVTDDKVKEFYNIHNRENDYSILEPGNIACYDGLIKVDLSNIEPMIALPFHPSNAFKISEVISRPKEFLEKIEEETKQTIGIKSDFKLKNKIENGKLKIDQGIIAGCSGGSYENIAIAAEILKGRSTGNSFFSLSIFPASQPIYSELIKKGHIENLINAGALIKTAFCGPCFGAGDTPSNEGFSIRHTTRNFPNREGSKPNQGQLSFVALMDARSIAATAMNKGVLTSASDIDYKEKKISYSFNSEIYKNRVFNGCNNPVKDAELQFGPNIVDWPEMLNLQENILLKIICKIDDPVTTTDELIPSGETSSYRSNPLKLAEFTLSRKAPDYVKKAKEVNEIENTRINSLIDNTFNNEKLKSVLELLQTNKITKTLKDIQIGSLVLARKPGDGSAREQAASCQKVLGGLANIAIEYATKRYRSNLINWGMLPFTISENDFEKLNNDDFIFIENILEAVAKGSDEVDAVVINLSGSKKIKLFLKDLSIDDRRIISKGSLINDYKS